MTGFALKVTKACALPTLPAASVAVSVSVSGPPVIAGAQFTAPPAPTVVATPLHVADVMPDSASIAVPLSDAGEAISVAPGAGDVMVTTGGVLSIFRSADAVAGF